MSHNLNNVIDLEVVRSASALSGRPGAEHSLSVCVVYQDTFTQNWAEEVCAGVSNTLGSEALKVTWWRLSDMSEPAVLAGAVSTALRADVLVLSVRAAEGFPLPFYVWVHSWLPHRARGAGAVVALIASAQKHGSDAARARDYIRALAEEGRLDFVVRERKSGRTAIPALDEPRRVTASRARRWGVITRQKRPLVAA